MCCGISKSTERNYGNAIIAHPKAPRHPAAGTATPTQNHGVQRWSPTIPTTIEDVENARGDQGGAVIDDDTVAFESWQFRRSYLFHQLSIASVLVAFAVELVFTRRWIEDIVSILLLVLLLTMRSTANQLARASQPQRWCCAAYLGVVGCGSLVGIAFLPAPGDHAQLLYITAITGIMTPMAGVVATSIALPRWMFYVSVACDLAYCAALSLGFREASYMAQVAAALAFCQFLQCMLFELIDRSNRTQYALLENLSNANERREYEITILRHQQQQRPSAPSPEAVEEERRVAEEWAAAQGELMPRVGDGMTQPSTSPPPSIPPGPPSSSSGSQSSPRSRGKSSAPGGSDAGGSSTSSRSGRSGSSPAGRAVYEATVATTRANDWEAARAALRPAVDVVCGPADVASADRFEACAKQLWVLTRMHGKMEPDKVSSGFDGTAPPPPWIRSPALSSHGPVRLSLLRSCLAGLRQAEVHHRDDEHELRTHGHGRRPRAPRLV